MFIALMVFGQSASAAVVTANTALSAPAVEAEQIRQALVQAQLKMSDEAEVAGQQVTDAQARYVAALASPIATVAPEVDARIRSGFDVASHATANGQMAELAVARARIWTALLDGSYRVVLHALQSGDGTLAKQWLSLREFRHATRVVRPGADATLAVTAFAEGQQSAELAQAAVQADLLDTYQARLNEALADLRSADTQGFASRRAEMAALAEGYFAVLAPSYSAQRGAAAMREAQTAFASLSATAQRDGALDELLVAVDRHLQGFRAAPLSPSEQVRRANRLLRFLALVPVEYGRGVRNGTVTVDLEIREAITFRDSAAAAFADLRWLLDERDAAATANVGRLFNQLGEHLTDAGAGTAVADPSTIEDLTAQIAGALTTLMPAEWQKTDLNREQAFVDIRTTFVSTATNATDYCVEQGGEVVTRRATYGTGDDVSKWQPLGGERDFCDFSIAAENETTEAISTFSLDLATLWSTGPTLATLAYYDPPLPQAPTEGVDPVSAYCSLLGGSSRFDEVTGRAGAWAQAAEGNRDDTQAVVYCLFPDESMFSAQWLYEYADGRAGGIDPRVVLRYRPAKLPDIYPGCTPHEAVMPGLEALPVAPNEQAESDPNATAYCEQVGGQVITRTFNHGTNADRSLWLELATPYSFCEFDAKPGTGAEADSHLAVDVGTLYSKEPTLATMAYADAPAMGDRQPGVNPAAAYCSQLGGSASPTGLENAAGGGWVKTGEPIMIMCVFADGSMIDAWALTHRANGSIHGIELSTVLR